MGGRARRNTWTEVLARARQYGAACLNHVEACPVVNAFDLERSDGAGTCLQHHQDAASCLDANAQHSCQCALAQPTSAVPDRDRRTGHDLSSR